VTDPETTPVIGQRRCKQYASSSFVSDWATATTDLAAPVLLLPFKNLPLST